jgi:hypothetical protein
MAEFVSKLGHLDVSDRLWQAVAEDCGVPFADSYLCLAREINDRLTAHTLTAYKALRANKWAMAAFRELGIRLIEPLPIGHPDRPDTK